MANDVLNTLLKEYEHKKLVAELDLDKRKSDLYALYPELEKIESDLNSFAIDFAKSTLLGKKSPSLKKLNIKINNLKKEREKILVSNGYDSSYLKPSYECSLCNDTGFVKKDNKKVMCSCLKQRLLENSYDSSNLFNLKSENFSTFKSTIFSNKVDFEKYGQNISPRENILNIKDKAIEFVENFDDPNSKNLLFSGNTGSGKSFMSNCIAAEVLKRNKTVLYQTAPVLLEGVIDYKMSRNKDLKNNVYKTALESDLLIIDDLGTESLNSMKLSELFTILNTRLLNLNNKVVKTIISTNLNIKEIFSFYEERIGSRIAGFYDIYYFFGNDLRLAKKRK